MKDEFTNLPNNMNGNIYLFLYQEISATIESSGIYAKIDQLQFKKIYCI